jgi:hypothetical protein
MMIYRYILTFVFITLFSGLCSAQDKPEKLSAKEAAKEFIKNQEKAEKDGASVIDKIDADTMMAVLAIFISKEAEEALNNAEKTVQNNKLLKQIAEIEKKPLSIVKFDMIKDLFEAQYKENEEVRRITIKVLNDIKKLQEEQRVANEKLQEEQRVANEKLLEERRIANEKLLEEQKKLQEEQRIANEKLLEEQKKLQEEQRVANEKLQERQDVIKKLLEQQVANATTLDNKIKELEGKLINDQSDKDTCEQLIEARFIREIIRKNINADEIRKSIFNPLIKMDMIGMEVDTIRMETVLGNSFFFLERYYEGLILEYLGKNDDALFAFRNAEAVTSDPKYKIIAASKIFEITHQ